MVVAVRDDEAAERKLQEAIDADDELNPRAAGIHTSDIIHCLIPGWARLHLGLAPMPSAKQDPRWAAMLAAGQGFHTFLQNGRREDHPILSLSEDPEEDIHCSVDDLDHVHEDGAWSAIPEEIKSTRYGAKKPIDEMAEGHYLEQLGTYVLAKLAKWGRLYGLHLMGNYGGDRMPIFQAHRLYYSDRELTAWAKELLRRVRILRSPDLPRPVEHQDGDCAKCKYNVANAYGGDGGPLPRTTWTPDGWCRPQAGRGTTGFFHLEEEPEWAQPKEDE